MTKLIEPIDCAAFRGAKRKAIAERSSLTMTRRAKDWVGSSDNNLMETLSDNAKAVASCFGMMRPGAGEMVFGMRENRPSAPMQAGLDELVAAGALKREPFNSFGGVRYVPQLNLSDFTKWLGRNQHRPELCFPISVPIVPDGEKADKT